MGGETMNEDRELMNAEIRRVEQMVIALDRRLTELFVLDAEARDVARRDVERRLEAMNELREQLYNERGRYVTRELYDERHEDLSGLVATLDNRISSIEGGSQMRAATIGWLIAGMGLAVTVVIVIVNIATAHS